MATALPVVVTGAVAARQSDIFNRYRDATRQHRFQAEAIRETAR